VLLAAILAAATLIGVAFAAGAGAGARVGAASTPPHPGATTLPTPSPATPAAAAAGLSDPAPPLDPVAWPVVPTIDRDLQARLQEVFEAGRSMGNREGVFAKVGNSITATTEFLSDLGCGAFDLGHHTDLRDTIDAFAATAVAAGSTTPWCGTSNSFNRTGVAATIGWRADEALRPFDTPPARACAPARYDTPLTCELRMIRPSIALIMFGTNDMSHDDLPLFIQEMTTMVRTCVAMGVIPVISTVPPRNDSTTMDDRVTVYNRAIVQVARTERVPLWNYWLALDQPDMVDRGIGGDGVHPNSFGSCSPRCQATNFTDEGLRYGFNQRNFTAVEILRKIRDVVFDDGAPDSGPAVQVLDGTVSPSLSLARLDQTVTWTFDAGNTERHAVADATGLALFDSGPTGPGATFSFAFPASATYAFVDRLQPNSLSGTVGVPPSIEPALPVTGAPIVVTWATAPPGVGLVFDVQVLRPGADWVPWRSDRTVTDGTFRAGQPGTFGFQARVRDPVSGTATAWSPTAWVTVSGSPAATGSA
jgi:hypothetical protein